MARLVYRTVVFAALPCCVLLAHLVAAGEMVNAGAPDPERAWEHRDMQPVSTWLDNLPPERREGVAALRARAWLARRDGRPEAALALIERAIELAPDDADLRVDRGGMQSDQLNEAGPFKSFTIARNVRKDLKHAVEVEPDHVDALVALVTFHQRAPAIVGGRDRRARELTERLAHLAPERLLVRRAMALAGNERFDDAVDAMRRAIDSADQARPKWFVRVGRWLRRLGRHRTAREAFEQALVEAPRYTEAFYEIGRLGAESGRDVDAAIDALRRYLELPLWPGDPEPKRAWLQLGHLYRHAGRREAAEAAFRCALELDPGWEEARRALDRLLSVVESRRRFDPV